MYEHIVFNYIRKALVAYNLVNIYINLLCSGTKIYTYIIVHNHFVFLNIYDI